MAKRGNSKILTSARQAVKDAFKQAKLEKLRAQDIAKEQIKEMRPYLKRLRKIDLRKEISGSQRSYISKAWQEYQELTTRPHKVYRTRNKKHLSLAQAFGRHEKGKPNFDVAFVPTADPKAKLQFTKDGIRLKSKYVTETILFFDLRNLAANPADEIAKTLAKNPDAKQFIIMAGKYLYNGGLARSLVENKVHNLMLQYSPGGAMYEKRGPNSHFENWLFGLVAFEAHNQVSVNEYRQAYGEHAQRIKNSKGRARKRRQYKYGKKF